MNQPDLFSYVPPIIFGDRSGETFEPKRDGARLNRQAQDVFNFIADHCWHTLREIGAATGHPKASVSARCRDFRKERFGGFTVERRFVGNGVWQYRLLP